MSELLETQLEKLTPDRLSNSLLARLELCMQSENIYLSKSELQHETWLRESVKPVELSAGLQQHLLTQILQKQSHQSIVHTPLETPKKSLIFKTWQGAAAVAIIGAASALLIHKAPESTSGLAQSSHHFETVNQNLIPANYQRGVKNIKNEGVIWNDSRPQRVVRVEYLETMSMKDEQGRTYQVQQPRTKYLMIPQKVD